VNSGAWLHCSLNSGAMLNYYSFLPQEKQPNAASPKPAVSF